jgi:hypothetical protein
MNYNTVLTDKPSDSSLTDILSGWDKLAGKPQKEIASLMMWQIRYEIFLFFCSPWEKTHLFFL